MFVPFGMEDSSYVHQERWNSNICFSHDSAGKPTGVNEQKEANTAGSMKTSTRDYTRFVIALMEGAGLGAPLATEMTRPQSVAGTGDALRWGLGVGLEIRDGETWLWHWGDNGNAKCFFLANPARNEAVLWFSGSTYGLGIVDAAISALFEEHPALTQSGFLDEYTRYDAPAMDIIRTYYGRGIDAAERVFTGIAGTAADAGLETAINSLAYEVMRGKNYPDAIRLLRLNAGKFPLSANCWDSLAEAYLVSGDTARAKEFYRKALDVDPAFPSAIAALKKIEEDK